MSKQLLIIRHAKSDWDNNLSDFDRPLTKRGERNAPEIAEKLLKKRIRPQHLISSPAKRAITTAGYFADKIGFDRNKIQKEESIYEAGTSNLLKVINKMDNKYDIIALFGHNPGLTSLVQYLSNADISNIPTCGVVFIRFPFDDWSMISKDTGNLQFFDYPKNDG